MSRVRRTPRSLVLTVLLGAVAAAAADEISLDFSRSAGGSLPAGLAAFSTGKSPPGAWKILDDIVPAALPPLSDGVPTATAKHSVLAQVARTGAAGFQLLLLTNRELADFTITTRLKITGGPASREAGLAFRARDESNYYVVRAGTEGNLLWFRVVGGVAHQENGIGVRIPVPSGTWEELRVECAGNQTRCFWNGQLLIPPVSPGAPTNGVAINDSTFSSGFAGFWTADGANASFADTRIEYTPRVPQAQTAVAEAFKKLPRLLGLKIYAPGKQSVPMVIADAAGHDIGTPGGKTESQVLTNGTVMYLKLKEAAEVTMPLRDRNGEIIAALKVTMTCPKGESATVSAARALKAKKEVESRLDPLQDIRQ